MRWMVPPIAAQTLVELQKMVRRAPGRVSRRAQALLWCLSGTSQTAVAARLGVSRQSVVRWCRRFQAAGPAGLADRPRSGRPPRLDAPGQRQLRRLLTRSDLPGSTGPGGWTAPQLAEQLAARGWPVSAKTVRCWAVRLGARWRRGRLVAKGDPERQLVLRQLAIEVQAAQRQARRQGRRLVVVFEDEADLALLPHVGYSWQLVDQPASVPTPGQNEKVALFGSLSLEGELVITEAPRKTARLLTQHLEQVAARFSNAVLVVIWDNVGIHHAKETATWLAAHSQVHPVHLPRYSPNDNAQERVWGWLRAKVCRNRAFRTLAAKRAAARAFLEARTPEELRRYCVPARLLNHLLAEGGAPTLARNLRLTMPVVGATARCPAPAAPSRPRRTPSASVSWAVATPHPTRRRSGARSNSPAIRRSRTWATRSPKRSISRIRTCGPSS
jgi:transposase